MDNHVIDKDEETRYNPHIRIDLMTKKFVLNTGEELTLEETIQLLLIRTNVLQSICDDQEQAIYSLTDQLEVLQNA